MEQKNSVKVELYYIFQKLYEKGLIDQTEYDQCTKRVMTGNY